MKIVGICFITVIVISFFTILVLAVKSGSFLKRILINALLGIMAFTAVELTSKLTGVYIPINIYTVCGSVLFGMPAVILFLILPFIF